MSLCYVTSFNTTPIRTLFPTFVQAWPMASGWAIYKGPRISRFASNLPPANGQPQIIEANLLDEVQLGRIAGPFQFPPFENFQIHPLGLVPKKNSEKWRTIFHLSYPKGSSESLNACIPIEDFTLQYIRIDDAISLVLEHGPGCFMTKTDIQSAFRIIPVHPEDWELLGMARKDHYYFDKALPFGLRSAPFIFNQLSESLEWLVKHYLKIPSIIHILDDFFIVQPPPSSHCATALCRILTLFTELNIPLAPNKTFRPTQVLEFMGITLDSVQMQARLPEDKLIRTRTLLYTWSSKRACVLRDLQSLIGSLQFACKVISPGRPFMQRIINLTHNVSKPGQLIYLNREFRKDVVMWQLFLDHWNGVSLFLPPFTEQSPDIHLYTDAAGSIGFGAFFDNQWFQGSWLPGHHLNPVTGISITWQELYPIYLACMLWGPMWANRRICFHCDNQATVSILSTKTSRIPRIMNLVRLITLQTLLFNFTFTAKHVPGVDNGIADSLSRFQMSRFRRLAPHASPVPCLIPLFLTKVWPYRPPPISSSPSPPQPVGHIPLVSAISFSSAFPTSSFPPNTLFYLPTSPPWSILLPICPTQSLTAQLKFIWQQSTTFTLSLAVPWTFRQCQSFTKLWGGSNFPMAPQRRLATRSPLRFSIESILSCNHFSLPMLTLLCYGLHLPLHFLAF